MKKVSIIIPAYDAEPLIAQTLDSVLQQTVTDFEVIVVNDGSTDQTATIVEQYMQKDDRITFITQENRGAAITRQLGQAASKGEFVAFLDVQVLGIQGIGPSCPIFRLKAPDFDELHRVHFAAC